jgi:DnaK suppressor protein
MTFGQSLAAKTFRRSETERRKMTTDNHREILIQKKKELSGTRLNREEIAIKRVPDLIDDVQNTTEREFALGSINRDWQTLRAIEQALQRLEEGSFGVCAECDRQIHPKRLQAVPWAALCLSCNGSHCFPSTFSR